MVSTSGASAIDTLAEPMATEVESDLHRIPERRQGPAPSQQRPPERQVQHRSAVAPGAPRQPPDATLHGQRHAGLNYSSQEYLSLARHPNVCAAAQAAMERYGVHSAGSTALFVVVSVAAAMLVAPA